MNAGGYQAYSIIVAIMLRMTGVTKFFIMEYLMLTHAYSLFSHSVNLHDKVLASVTETIHD